MMTNDAVRAVMIEIDSPGGSVDGTQELAEDLARLNAVKPVVAQVNDLCCSAAYWAASQATLIAANANALVGSLGTLMVVYDQSKHFEQEGVKPIVISTGTLKGAGARGTALSDELIGQLRALVEDANERFMAGVKSGRSSRLARPLGELWTGAVWPSGVGRSGRESAVELGLIDVVETADQTYERVKRMAARAV
jgi:signal peptide peptidase SppA